MKENTPWRKQEENHDRSFCPTGRRSRPPSTVVRSRSCLRKVSKSINPSSVRGARCLKDPADARVSRGSADTDQGNGNSRTKESRRFGWLMTYPLRSTAHDQNCLTTAPDPTRSTGRYASFITDAGIRPNDDVTQNSRQAKRVRVARWNLLRRHLHCIKYTTSQTRALPSRPRVHPQMGSESAARGRRQPGATDKLLLVGIRDSHRGRRESRAVPNSSTAKPGNPQGFWLRQTFPDR